MKIIPWVDVYQRKYGTNEEMEIIESYPFPDVLIPEYEQRFFQGIGIHSFLMRINEIEDELVKKCTKTRFEFIRDVWHPKEFIQISYKPWKYSS